MSRTNSKQMLAPAGTSRQFSPSLHIAVARAVVDEWFPKWSLKASQRVDQHLHLADLAMEGQR